MPLIFDLDGTLIDSLPGIAASLNQALTAKSLGTHSLTTVRRFIGDGSLELARRALPSGSPAALAREIEKLFKSHYAATWPAGTTLYPGISELIAALADRPLAILSNKPDAFTRTIVARLFPSGPFSEVRGQTDATARKPAPDGALAILSSWNVAPADAFFIGDSTVDRTTAENAGIPFIAVGWGYHNPAKLGPLVAPNVSELRRLLI